MKTNKANPITDNISKDNITTKSFTEHLLTDLKIISFDLKIKVANSGTAKLMNIHQIQTTCREKY